MRISERATRFQEYLGFHIKESTFIEQALIHPSYVQKRGNVDKVLKDKLHMLGDKLLRLLIADYTFHLVSTDAATINLFIQELDQRNFVLKLAEHLTLGSYIVSGKGFKWDEVKKEPIVYNILAAMYIEHGFNAVAEMVYPVFMDVLKDIKENRGYDYLSTLEDWAVRNSEKLVIHDLAEEIREEDGQILIKIEIQLIGKSIRAKGPSRELAIKRAAKEFIKRHLSKKFNPIIYRKPRVILPKERIEALKKIPFFHKGQAVLLHQSLVHKSYLNDDQSFGPLEANGLSTLGNYVQSFIFANHLFFNDENLGINDFQKLNQIHVFLIGYKTNSILFDMLELKHLLWTGRTVKSPSDKIKTDSVKALFAAMYLSKRDYHIEPKSMFKIFLHQYIPDIAKEFKREELDPKSMLIETTRLIGPSWECKFQHNVVKNDERFSNRVEGIVEITNRDNVMYRQKGKGTSSKEAYSTVSRRILHDMTSAFNLTEIRESRAPYSLMLTELLSQILYTSQIKEKKAREISSLLGGLGLISLESKLYREAFADIKSTVKSLELMGIYDIEQVFYHTYEKTGFIKDFKYNILDINPYLQNLSRWLKTLSFDSPIEELGPFIKNITDVLQVFRFLDEHSFEISGLVDIFNRIKGLNYLLLDLDISYQDENVNCFGKLEFTMWFFNIIIDYIRDSLMEQTPLPVKVELKKDPSGDSLVEITFDPSRVKSQFYEDLYIVTQFAPFMFMGFEVEQGNLKFRCFHFDLKNENERPNNILLEVHHNQIKSAMELSPLGGLLHDLKHGLNTVKRKILKRKGTTEELEKLGKACLELTNQLLAFFQYTKVQKHRFYLDDLIVQIEEELKTVAINEDSVKIDSDIDLSTIVSSDKKMIHSVITNLAKNGLESLDPLTGHLHMTFSLNGDLLEMTISDNGCGIPLEKQKTLFTSFYTTKTSSNGSGVGLPTVKRIVDLLKGEISFESDQNKGTTFYINIPVKQITTVATK